MTQPQEIKEHCVLMKEFGNYTSDDLRAIASEMDRQNLLTIRI